MCSRSRKIVVGSMVLIPLAISAYLAFNQMFLNYPYLSYVDEGHIVRHAMNLYRVRAINPGWYDYGTGIMFATNITLRTLQALHLSPPIDEQKIGIWPGSKSFKKRFPPSEWQPNYNIVDPPDFLIAGRLIMGICTVLTTLALFLTLRELIPTPYALAGTFLFATIPAFAVHAHGINNDTPMTFMAALTLLFCLRWQKSGNIILLGLTGIAIGFAAACKISGILLLIIPGVLLLTEPATFKRRLWWSVGLCTGFIGMLGLSYPTLFLRPRNVLWGSIYTVSSYGKIVLHTPMVIHELEKATILGFPLLILALLGPIFAPSHGAIRRFFTAAYLFCIAIVLVFLEKPFQPVRNMYQLFPIMILFTTWVLWRITEYLTRKTPFRKTTQAICLTAISLLVTTQFFFAQKAQNQENGITDSRIKAIAWLTEHAQSGQTIATYALLSFHPQVLAKLEHENGLSFHTIDSLNDPAQYIGNNYIALPLKIGAEEEANLKKLRQKLEEAGYKPQWETGVESLPTEIQYFVKTRSAIQLYARS